MLVYTRLRPFIPEDFKRANLVRNAPEVCVHLRKDGQTIKLIEDVNRHKHYAVDHTFDISINQADTYNNVLHQGVVELLHGSNVTTLCYGGTGTGQLDALHAIFS